MNTYIPMPFSQGHGLQCATAYAHDFMVWILLFGGLVAPLSICSVLYALILRITFIFQKEIVRMPTLITMTFIIFAELFSHSDVPYSGICLFMFYSCTVLFDVVVCENPNFV
jgi:hypothetical protein